MDHQSPGRAELFDRFSDEDSPLRSAVGIIGCYRAQELFTFQVADAMVRAIRRAARRTKYGFPEVPGVLAAVRRPFRAAGRPGRRRDPVPVRRRWPGRAGGTR